MASLIKGALLLENINENELPTTSLSAIFIKDNKLCIKLPNNNILSLVDINEIDLNFIKTKDFEEFVRTIEKLSSTINSNTLSIEEIHKFNELIKQEMKKIDKLVTKDSAVVNDNITIKTENSETKIIASKSSLLLTIDNEPVITYDLEKQETKTGNFIRKRKKGSIAGVTTLENGISKIVTNRVTKDTNICLHRQLCIGSPGTLFIQTIENEEYFIIKSTSNNDKSSVYWYLEELGE